MVHRIVWQRALFPIYGIDSASVTVIVNAFMRALKLERLGPDRELGLVQRVRSARTQIEGADPVGSRAQQRCDPRSSASCGRSGFTLLELLLVIAIIGLLASIAITNSTRFVYKARRTEAYNALKAINEAQQVYLTDAGQYASNFEALGLDLIGGTMIDPQTIQTSHYTYTLVALDQNGRTASNFRAVAAGNIDPSDDMLDVLIIENQLTVLD